MGAERTAGPPGQPHLDRLLAVARGDEPADLLLAGGRVLDVFTGDVLAAGVAIWRVDAGSVNISGPVIGVNSAMSTWSPCRRRSAG